MGHTLRRGEGGAERERGVGGGGGWRRALKGDKARGRAVSGEGLLFLFFSVSVCIALHCVALRCDFLFIFILYFFSLFFFLP